MSKDEFELSVRLHRKFSKDFLLHLKTMNSLPYEELALFDWYIRETEQQYSEMLRVENAFIQEQINADVEEINDSGMLPVLYFIKRARNSSVLQLAALIEGYVSNVCWRLSTALGDRIIFALNELSGQDWVKERKFIERYGSFNIPDDLWAKIKMISTVRNALIHDNGVLSALTDKEREKNVNFYKGAPGINAEGYELLVETEFLQFALKAFHELINFVDEHLGNVIDRTVLFAAKADGTKI
jgi:hypothetical protein